VEVSDKEVPAKVDGEAAALPVRPKKPRLTKIQKLQSAVEDQRKTRSESQTAAKSGKEKQGRVAEESGKALKEKPTKEKAQGSKGQKGTENKIDKGGKKSKKGTGSNVKVRKCLSPLVFFGGGGGGWLGYKNLSGMWCAAPQNSLFLCLQIQQAKRDADMATYAKGDTVHIMGYGVEE
jgi:hypothetical protein